LIELAKEHDVGVIIKKPLGAGKLIPRYGAKRLLEFVLENPDVHTAIPGMPRPEHVWEDVPMGYR
jgi:predicted aldo/keto reductase-like oxidoreductase